ncbi:MAG: Lrp/AsnC family transcriptional regulator [Chloroflexi bacterium]|nr:Lrp/AsnC family transcriptional regulator [Chloroflexota bacterium]
MRWREVSVDDIDRRLLNLAQGFPVARRPYAELGRDLGLSEDAVIRRLGQLKAERLIRQIGPVIDARKLGYQTTLVAVKVTDGEQVKAEKAIAGHPGVSHGYEREHDFNIWFTLSAPAGVDLEGEIARLTTQFDAAAVLHLPALRVFKLDVYFDMVGNDGRKSANRTGPAVAPQKIALSPEDRAVINELQQDLPLVPAPFDLIAEKAGLSAGDFLARCRTLQDSGIIRRFGAALAHRKAGFTANGMACWVVPPPMVDATGQRLATLKEVSHCYERRTGALWPYNLFAMVHSTSREACEAIRRQLSVEYALPEGVMLFSTREFKKARVKYLV